jgi:hypothetical protein
MDTSLDRAIQQFEDRRKAYEAACLEVWQAIQLEHPVVAASIIRLGWEEMQAAAWLCEPQRPWNESPATLVNSGRDNEVVELIGRTLAGTF